MIYFYFMVMNLLLKITYFIIYSSKQCHKVKSPHTRQLPHSPCRNPPFLLIGFGRNQMRCNQLSGRHAEGFLHRMVEVWWVYAWTEVLLRSG